VNLFFEPLDENLEVFPLLEVTQVFEVDMEAGMCLFVPAWWWVQSYTDDSEVLMTEMEFELHSQFFDLIKTGIDKEMILSMDNDFHSTHSRISQFEKSKNAKENAHKKHSSNSHLGHLEKHEEKKQS